MRVSASRLRGRVVVRERVAVLGFGGEARAAALAVLLQVDADAHGAAHVEFGRRVDDHEARHAIGMAAREERRDAAAERVTDQHQALDAELREHGFQVGDVELVVVAALGIAVGVAVAAQVEGERAVVGRDRRRRVVPDVGVIAEAVDEHERRAFSTPFEYVQRESVGSRYAEGIGFHADSLAT